MKSDREEFCKLKFDEFVRASSNFSSIRWEDVAQRDEPPDYFLYLDQTKYAVEVTTLMDVIEVGNNRLPRATVIASLSELVDEAEKTAKQNGFLAGAYAVSFFLPIPNFTKVRERILSGLLAYVQATQYNQSAPKQVILEQDYQTCTIEKMHNQKSYVGMAFLPGAKWEGDIALEVCTLLGDVLDSKCHKLRHIIEPKILLLQHAYLFASPENYRACLHRLKSLSYFHTVFLVASDQASCVLNSEDSKWLNSPK